MPPKSNTKDNNFNPKNKGQGQGQVQMKSGLAKPKTNTTRGLGSKGSKESTVSINNKKNIKNIKVNKPITSPSFQSKQNGKGQNQSQGQGKGQQGNGRSEEKTLQPLTIRLLKEQEAHYVKRLWVCVIAQCEAVLVDTYEIVLRLDDSTASISCKADIDTKERDWADLKGKYVQVVGLLNRSQKDELQLVATKVDVLTDLNRITYHFLSVMQSHGPGLLRLSNNFSSNSSNSNTNTTNTTNNTNKHVSNDKQEAIDEIIAETMRKYEGEKEVEEGFNTAAVEKFLIKEGKAIPNSISNSFERLEMNGIIFQVSSDSYKLFPQD